MDIGNLIGGLALGGIAFYGLVCSFIALCHCADESPTWMTVGYLIAICMQVLVVIMFVGHGLGYDMGIGYDATKVPTSNTP